MKPVIGYCYNHNASSIHLETQTPIDASCPQTFNACSTQISLWKPPFKNCKYEFLKDEDSSKKKTTHHLYPIGGPA